MARFKRVILVILAFLAGVAMTRLIERTSGGAELDRPQLSAR